MMLARLGARVAVHYVSTEKTDFVCEAVVIGLYSPNAFCRAVKRTPLREPPISSVLHLARVLPTGVQLRNTEVADVLACKETATSWSQD